MKINIPEHLKGKELYLYLKENKKQLSQHKKTGEKEGPGIGSSDSCDCKIKADKALKIIKAEGIDVDSLIVENIANLAGWMDYDDDVIINGAYNKTIADKRNNRPSLKNHSRNTDSIIGDTLEVRVDKLMPSDLGIDTDVITAVDAAVFKTQVRKGYSSTTYYQYKHGAIKEHSIGLRYIKIELAINDPEMTEEYAVWQKYYKYILNKNRADGRGLFWAVLEIDIIENSAVVFGSSSMTPTLTTEEGKEKQLAGGKATDDNNGTVDDMPDNNGMLNFYKNLV